MRISIPRLRIWFALIAIATALVVAGFYVRGLYRRYTAVKEIPKKLGLEIQQSTSDFTLSRSEGGRTLFTVRASKAVQFKQGGRATLSGVNIIVYGRNSSRYDQISGSDFEYDPSTGTIQAKGEVRIDLESNAQGASLPDQATPQELKDPIHLKTSGLIFNQKTGVAHTDDAIEFQIPQATGRARGVSYDSKANVLTFENDVVLTSSGPRPTEIRAASGEISKAPRLLTLNSVHITQTGSSAEANRVLINIKQDNTADRIDAMGDVRLHTEGPNAMDVRAPRGEILMAGKNSVRSAVFSGGVEIKSNNSLNGTAGKLALTFGAGNKLSAATASDSVHLLQPAANAKQQTVELAANVVEFAVVNGKVLRQAKTVGPATITMTPAKARPGEQTVITAGQFRAQFDDRSQLSVMYGEPNARIVSSVPGQPDRTATSRLLTVEFAKGGGVYSVVQEGSVEYMEPASGNTGERRAYAERAVLTVDDDTLALTGSPRVINDGMTVTAQSMRINRRTGDAFAQGSVKTTYSALRQEPNGAMLAKSDPVHVTARNMNAQRGSGIARYTGGARLWQGSNIVEAPTIEFNRTQRSLTAEGNSQPVKSVFVQAGKDGKATPITITAAKLSYVDADRRARYSGGVVARGQDMAVTSDHVDVLLLQGGTGADAPSQLQQIIADQHVVISSQDRRAVGEKLVYTAQDSTFVLTGGPPTITDAEHGTIRGDSLTFYSRDDRVVVESAGSSRTVTRTRIGNR